MLFPTETLELWAAFALLAAVLLVFWPRHWLLWYGLTFMAAGFVYFPFVMAQRPNNYYAILEFFTSITAISSGLITAAVGMFRLVFSRSKAKETQL